MALFFCFGTHHFCDPCHRQAWQLRNKNEKELKQCEDEKKCPLGIKHPPNGHEYALGCGLCREKSAEEKEKEKEKEGQI